MVFQEASSMRSVLGIHLLSKSRTSQPGFGNELCHVSSRRNSERMTFHGWLLGTLVGVPEEAPPCQGYCSKKHSEFSDGKPTSVLHEEPPPLALGPAELPGVARPESLQLYKYKSNSRQPAK